ncbi:MAG TPA: SDR family oxidoreductase, partial [Bacteroidota bacterium]|nr:SDR family oxidoreductase [Bacteroidota bacterium]
MAEHFFITGATGLVGTDLVPRILTSFPESTVTLLVRAGSDAQARERLDGFIRTIGRRDELSRAAERLEVMRGDVEQESCGLSAANRNTLVRRTTHIIHGAATIRFDESLEKARSVNCGGTKRMLALAAVCADRGALERFVYIGSSSVSGKREGMIREDELEMGQQFFNTYEQSKCESERLVRDSFARLPAVAFRPSIIIGDSKTGRTTSFYVIYIPLRLLYNGLLDIVPGSPGTFLDLVPVDWVNAAMIALFSRKDSVGRVFHITAGPSRAARLGEVVESAAAYFNRHAPLSKPRHVTFVSAAEYARVQAGSSPRMKAVFAQLDALFPYVTVNRLFDSRNADEFLRHSGVALPPF